MAHRDSRQRVVTMPTRQLTPHPLHGDIFFEPAVAQLRNLCKVVHESGIPEPLHVIPGGQVVSDPWWLLAARAEKLPNVDVLLREDLVDASNATIAEALITLTVGSRSISGLEEAASYKAYRRFAINRLNRGGGDSRDQIVARLGLRSTGRHLDRLVPLLELPLAIRRAIAKRKVSQPAGFVILSLPATQREAIASDLEAGQSWREIRFAHRLAQSHGRGLYEKLAGLITQLDGINALLDDDGVEIRSVVELAPKFLSSAKLLARSLRRRVGQRATDRRTEQKPNNKSHSD